jgi:hypothetical protein
MFHRSSVLRVGLVAFAAMASTSGADVLYLKTGGRLEGVLTQETRASLTLDLGMGQVSVPRESVLRVEHKESALSEYRSRLTRIAPGDVQAEVELARFAAERGLRAESRQMWARILSTNPTHVEAHLALGHVLLDGNYVDEAEAYRARGFVYFDSRWMTTAEQTSLLREREQRVSDDRRVEEARRATREAEERARRAEREAVRARAETASNPSFGQPWGYGSSVIIGSPYGGGYGGGCSGASCVTVPSIWPVPPPPPAATPIPRARPVRPSSIR